MKNHYSIGYFISQAVKGLWRNGVMSFASIAVLMCCLVVMGIFTVLVANINENLETMELANEIVVFLDYDATEDDAKRVEEKIKELSTLGVGEVVFVSKEQALEEQRLELKADPVEQLGYNPYEAEIELTLKPEYANKDSLVMIEKSLLRNKEVKELIYQQELMDSVNEGIQKIGLTLLAFLAMLTLISWSLISNLVRLSIYSKRFLMHTMKLTGATWGFIRRPFIVSNMWIGLLSGVLANAMLAAGIYFLQQQEPVLMAYLPIDDLAVVGAAVILFGITICSLCAFLSVNRFLRMRNNDLYFI